MLKIQRASAGSGKTYALARRFILFLISWQDESGSFHLAKDDRICDNLRHILAITFTNKATAEMRERIVAKLEALAVYDPSSSAKKPDYLDDFCDILDATPQDISHACAVALHDILNHYSDFKVSTIDSFFQEILRTFTYESNLNENFNIEIDSDYITGSALDSLFHDIDSGKGSKDTARWISILMKEKVAAAASWNVFGKSTNQRSIYKSLLKALKELEKEEFKSVKDELTEYFKQPGAHDLLYDAYIKLDGAAKKEREAAFDKIIKCRDEFLKLLDDPAYPQRRADCNGNILKQIIKIGTLSYDSKTNFKPYDVEGKGGVFKSGKNPPGAELVNEAAIKFYEAVRLWRDPSANPLWFHNKAYKELIPYLGILQKAIERIDEMLLSSNLVQLSATNTILKKIIGDDDTPFVYERIGSYIDHYLIDEFQDTSRLQWEILRPLVMESHGRNKENLIIGDAKQSIYRFRNADPSLIMTRVPLEFKRHEISGENPSENINWRSCSRVVNFNNAFFSFLSKIAYSLSLQRGGSLDFKALYSNVEQLSKKEKDEGYIEIRFSDRSDSDKKDKKVLEEMTALIVDLHQRGYSFGDIAILVDKNSQGIDVVNALIDYNSSLPEGGVKIEFISEESLLPANSEAVKIIVGVISMLASGRKNTPETKVEDSDAAEKTSGKNKYIKWSQIKDAFRFYSISHPDVPIDRQLIDFLSSDNSGDPLEKMLEEAGSLSLPAVVEAVVGNFVPHDMCVAQAPYISAFQDMVIEYCERFPADPASFIEWWKAKGSQRSISFPEGVDAVQIMTIHKSKGLEFQCVILPYATRNLLPSEINPEWKWVRVPSLLDGFGLPPALPVELKTSLTETSHAGDYSEYIDNFLMDRLNTAYVAFTRAVRELYIFANKDIKSGNTISHHLRSHLDTEEDIVCIGEKTPPPPKDSESNAAIPLDAMTYQVNDAVSRLKFRADSLPAVSGEDETEETADPRSEGTLLHAVMQQIDSKYDVRRALLKMKTKGMINAAQMNSWESMIKEALAQPVPAQWYDGTWDVITERAIFTKDGKTRRPDRVLLNKEGTKVVVIDFKFGNSDNHKRYASQMRGYVKAVGIAFGVDDVEGYIWYPRTGEVDSIN